MKKFLLVALLLIPMMAIAQRIDKPGESYDYFCIVTYNIESKAVIAFNEDNLYVCDEDFKEIKFGSLPELLTYLSKRGWSFVWEDEVKVLTQRCPRILMKKSVTEDKQATEGLNLKSMTKKKKE